MYNARLCIICSPILDWTLKKKKKKKKRRAENRGSGYEVVLILQSCLIVMASSSKRPRVAESDSEDSDSPFEMAEESTAGSASGEESELDRLLEN